MKRILQVARSAASAVAMSAILSLDVTAQEPAVEPLDSFPRGHLEIEARSGRQPFEVWIADTAPRRAQGLMFVKALAPQRGMLFLYREPRVVSMWMKNTLIPLDMLFVAADGRIIRIAPRTTPHSLATITSMGPVTGVIEIAGGEAERLGIETGARVLYPAFGTLPKEP
jgi:uncharacterized membrane protein (UPF0127 family)